MFATRLVDQRLLGTWRSDAELTLAEWAFTEGTPKEAKDIFACHFGKLAMRYTAARIFTEFEGDHTVCSYRVVATDQSSVAIVRRTAGKNELQHIHFVDPNIYWVSVGRSKRQTLDRSKTEESM